jgi:transposase InsO family protein
MPWKEVSMYEQRLAAIHQVLTLKRSVTEVAREAGVTRKTMHKWLKRYRSHEPFPLQDRSRRPSHSPCKTEDALEQAVVEIRQKYRWGPRKIHRMLLNRWPAVPSVRTVASILSRRNCVETEERVEPAPPRPFERSFPNELWQIDHKGAIEVARQRVCPLTVLDDYSRYCLCFTPVPDVTMQTTWDVLWGLFERFGLPESILCDNAFGGAHHSMGLSWFDANLVRLNIKPIHGRPYHPQTQGKVERFHGTVERELIEFDARRDSFQHFEQDVQRWRTTYNTIRPHEALGDLPPVVRWKPSTRPRPATLPEAIYPPDAITRTVSFAGDFRYHNARILVGRSLSGEKVRIEPRDQEIAVYYSWKLLRVIPNQLLKGPRCDKMV